ncbi:tetratricopeptide repeat-containing sulfotransferase family protein [Thiohalobacter sp.]|uniref:tetratricopeptide repeat-containing sulfotransferase family protein n=1 Tax=Thiohalobacter sp. TaxID=2025948 RepID=UPI00261BC5B2|nr:tetratricopeptide repeat-containing sulfotransferase family protein [Thiohalobacter sp.]
MKAPPKKAQELFRKATAALEQGNPRDALAQFEKIEKIWERNPDICYLKGLALGRLGRIHEVAEVSREGLKLAPDHHGCLCNLANAQMTLQETEAALGNYERALALKPGDPNLLNNYARALALLGRRDEAVEIYRRVVQTAPNYAPAHVSLGRAHYAAGQLAQAAQAFFRALRLDPRQYEAHLGLGRLLENQGGLEPSRRHYEQALKLFPDCIDARVGLATLCRYEGDFERAMTYLEEAAERAGADNPSLLAGKANLLEYWGKREEAHAIVTALAERGQLTPTAVTVHARLCHHFDDCDRAEAHLKDMLAAPATDEAERYSLYFAAGSMMDRQGRYPEAFEYYRKGNEAVNIRCDRARFTAHVDALIETFSRENLAHFARAETGSDRPIFIVGMPRSGTSLTEQILASHPEVAGGGELDTLARVANMLADTPSAPFGENSPLTGDAYLKRLPAAGSLRLTELASKYLDHLDGIDASARHVTDKMPHNFLRLGLIQLLFPEARIIHCRRNPLDTCLSIYFQQFIWSHDYAWDLSDLGFHYSEYWRLMQHWERTLDIPILTIDYEDMVADQAAASRRLLEFCGLEWREDVLEFHRSERAVTTASYDQVRRPIYKSSRERWRNYADCLAPLVEALSDEVRARIPGLEAVPAARHQAP